MEHRIRDLTRSPRSRLCATAATAAALVVMAAGCGGGGGASTTAATATTGSGATQTIKVSETQGVPSAIMKIGIKKGFFRQEGLNIELNEAKGGAASIPGLIGGNFQIVGSNSVSVLLGIDKGLPLKIIAPGDVALNKAAEDWAPIMVGPNSSITSLKVLTGKTVAINTLNNIDYVAVRHNIDQAGGDSSKVKFTEIPFPEMGTALQTHQVDAIAPIEPFATMARAKGAKRIADQWVPVRPGLMIGVLVTTDSYAKQHPDVVRSFQKGQAETARFVNQNPKQATQLLVGYGAFEADIADKVTLPARAEQIDRGSLKILSTLMARYGVTKAKPDFASAIFTG